MIRTGRGLDGRRILHLPGGGPQLRLHNLVAFMLLLVALLAMALASLLSGQTQLDWGTLSDLLRGRPVDEDQAFALLQIRLPRVLLGIMAGCCVALSGAILQTLARNPLADPGLLGLSQGAMVAILLLGVAAPGLSRQWLPFAGFAGGLAVAVLLVALVGRNRAGGLAMLLMGIAIETTLSAVTSILILYTPPEQSFALSAWLAGSLFHANWATVATLAPWFIFALAGILLIGGALRPHDLGPETAMALGEDVRRSRLVALLLAVLISSAALSAVGPLMFLGVMAPHLAGFLSPASGRARLLLSALTGGLLVTAADMLTRNAATGIALPVGLSLVIVGAPLFIITMRLRLLARMDAK